VVFRRVLRPVVSVFVFSSRSQNVVVRFLLLIVCFAALPLATYAHGDLLQQITAVTTQLEKQPGNVELLLRRAELRRLHGELGVGLRDCALAEQLQLGPSVIQFIRGKILNDAGRYAEARTSLDRFLEIQPKNAEALTTRARILMTLSFPEKATADYSAAIALSTTAEPDLFLERAQAWEAANQPHRALTGLDDGIAKLGPIASLELAAIELELQLEKFDNSLARVDALATQSQRKEGWLKLRGEILECAGRREEAQASFQKAMAAIEKLPSRFKEDGACKKLRVEVVTALARLSRK
jgi:tetratricopeptide (TPR) repeat protein